MIAYTRGVKGPVVDEEAIAFLFNTSPSADVTEGGTGASEAPRMDAEAFASYILEQFKARVARSSRRPWVEAKEYIYQLWGTWRYRDEEFIRVLSETAAYPDKLDFDELMGMWLSLPRRERKKARTLIAYKVAEYGAEEFLKLISQSEKLQEDAELRRALLRVAQAFVNKNIGVFNLTLALERMYLYASLIRVAEDVEEDARIFLAGTRTMELSRKDRIRELVKKYIVDELTAIERRLEEEEEDEDILWDYVEEEFGADEYEPDFDDEPDYDDYFEDDEY